MRWHGKSRIACGAAPWVVAVTFLVALWVFVAYFPGYLHGDAQIRWRWAYEMAGGSEMLDESDYFHPFMTYLFLGVLTMSLPVWVLHAGQVLVFYAGFLLLIFRLLPGWRIWLALPILLLPPVWNFSALQSSDTWFLAGCLWYLFGMAGRICPQRRNDSFKDSAAVRDYLSVALGVVLIFCTRYNAAPLVLVLLTIGLARLAGGAKSRPLEASIN